MSVCLTMTMTSPPCLAAHDVGIRSTGDYCEAAPATSAIGLIGKDPASRRDGTKRRYADPTCIICRGSPEHMEWCSNVTYVRMQFASDEG